MKNTINMSKETLGLHQRIKELEALRPVVRAALRVHKLPSEPNIQSMYRACARLLKSNAKVRK